MLRLLGNDPFKPCIEAGLFCLKDCLGAVPLNDLNLGEKDSPWLSVDPAFLELVTDRKKFRIFCKNHGLRVPDGTETDSFQAASNWVVSHQKFPLVIKTRRNISSGEGIYRLEGFRDLLRFFERITKLNMGTILIEDWIAAKARIEVTVGKTGSIFISQVGLEASLFGRPAWRQFPIHVPKEYLKQIEEILKIFGPFLKNEDLICRFNFGILENKIYLLSANGGMNRIEYLPGWVPLAYQPAVFEILSGKESKAATDKKNSLSRLMFFKKPAKAEPWPETLPSEEIWKLPIQKYAVCKNNACILLAGKDLGTLAQDAQTLTALMNSI